MINVKMKIRNLKLTELTDLMLKAGFPKFRAQQIYRWLSEVNVASFDQMTNLPLGLRDFLERTFDLNSLTLQKVLKSRDESTTKFLFKLPDGNLIESALMKYKYGYSVCVSTQVGCRMGCAFCVSGMNGFVRNLEASEILEQVVLAQKFAGVRIGRVVLMGIGEPLDNFENVVRFIELVSCLEGLNIGQRNISLSTSGLVNRIYDLMRLKLQITLSISVHAPNDLLRSKLMPINRTWNLLQLVAACREYFEATHRRVSFEYIMLSGVNDDLKCTAELKRLLAGFPAHVNLIPANEGRKGFKASDSQTIKMFQKNLEDLGVQVTLRRALGSDVSAACGQMRCAIQGGKDGGF
jgi:23S rRNA (adenine2503-C2)-methyltransferase